MTLHVSRLPFALDPLIGEAKRRARQRRFLVASALLLAALAAGLTLGLRSSGGGPSGGLATAGVSVHTGGLAVAVPRDFHRFRIRGGLYRTGTRPPVIGVVVTDYRPGQRIQDVLDKWAGASSNGPPASRVALELSRWVAIGPPPPARLHLPLNLDQPWFQEHFRDGVVGGYRYGYLSFHGQLYDILFWSGQAAPPQDRAAVLNMLTSIHPTH